MDQHLIKERAAVAAVDALVRDGMKLGLGTGSTAAYAVSYIARLLAEGKLRDIMAVPTSFQTTIECENNGIPLYTLNSRYIGGKLDLTIDGADEVDPQNRCIKGGGGALLTEKIVAYASETYALIIGEEKLTENLGVKFPIPVELIPDARLTVSRSLKKLGAKVKLREGIAKAGPVITDHGNFIMDISFDNPVDPAALEAELNLIPGVVENGFFTWPSSLGVIESVVRPSVFIGKKDGSVERRD